MYRLTEKGLQELNTYAGADDMDLRLTGRTLMVPVLESIYTSVRPSFKVMQADTGFDRPTLSGILSNLHQMGMIERLPPGPDATKEERDSWRHFRYRREHPKKWIPTKDQRRQHSQRRICRYPEVARRNMDDWRLSWKHRHGEEKE